MTEVTREDGQLGSVLRNRVDRLLRVVEARTSAPEDSHDERQSKAALVLTVLAIVVLSTFWVTLYSVLGLWLSAAIPFGYQVVSLVFVAITFRSKRAKPLLYQQLFCMLVLPFALQWSLGGFVNGSAVMVWAIMAPIAAMVFAGPRAVMVSFAGFVILTVISGLLDPVLASNAPAVPQGVQTLMFALDIGTPAVLLFLLLRYFFTELRREREKSDRLLYQMLPRKVAERLREESGPIADTVPDVSILFADVVGFTPLSTQISPEELIGMLNRLFAEFDRLSQELGVEKLTTMGDGYIAAAGVPAPRPDHAEAVADLALGMQGAVRRLGTELGREIQIRIGINSGGPVVAGVVGTTRYMYSIIGDAMNTASRMESQGVPGKIQVTEATYERLRDRYALEERGIIEVKGKGPMRTFFLEGAKQKREDAKTSRAAPLRR